MQAQINSTFLGHFGLKMLALAPIASLLIAHTAHAACTSITTVPYVITSPGNYCLENDISTSITAGNAITIESNNVVVDLQGYTITGNDNPDTLATGIFSENQGNIKVRNGQINGFANAVALNPGVGLVTGFPENVLVENMTVRGSRITGVTVRAVDAIIKDNTVFKIGGSTIIPESIGINLDGGNIRVINNDISQITLPASGNTLVAAILILHSTYILVINNRITYAPTGIMSLQSDTELRDNMTLGVDVPYVGGTDVGNNS